MSSGFDWDDLYIRAEEILSEKLGREPTADEIAEKAQDLYEDMASAAYDRAKDYWKYGE